MTYLSATSENKILLKVYIQPKSSRNRVTGIHDGMLKISITAPPVDGKANSQVIAFLAKLFKVPKSSITLLSGHQGRKKKVAVTGVDIASAKAILSEII